MAEGCLSLSSNGKKYNGKEIYFLDPHGAPELVHSVAPEEIEFLTYDESKLGTWAAFHFSGEYKDGSATGSQQNTVAQINHQGLDTTIEKNAHLNGKPTTTLVCLSAETRVIPLNLFHTLRVENVVEERGTSSAPGPRFEVSPSRTHHLFAIGSVAAAKPPPSPPRNQSARWRHHP